MTEADYLSRRSLLAFAGAGALAAPFAARAAEHKKWRGRKDAVIINALGGVGNPNANDEPEGERHWLDPRGLSDARASGLTATNITIGHVFGEGDPFEISVADVAWMDAAVRRYADDLLKVLSVADIMAAKKSRRVGLIYGFQNSEMFGDDPDRVDIFADLGVRVVQPTYNLRNKLGDGALVEENQGLTEFGRQIVARLNERKLLVDLSHAGVKTTFDALDASKVPIAITHTGCRALADHPRNKTDDELKALAAKGGVAGIYFMPYLTPGRQHRAEDIVRHIEHAVNVAGEDHVGIGTDGSVAGVDDMAKYMEDLRKNVEERRAQGVGAPNESAEIVLFAPDLTGATQFQKLGDLLAQRGHSEGRIEKILGGNFLRLFGEVWG